MKRDGLAGVSTGARALPGGLGAPHACHRRIPRYCRGLRALMLHVRACGQSREAQMAAHLLLLFFDNEVPQHCLDEEHDLFPALAGALAGGGPAGVREFTRHAIEQHRALAAEWAPLRLPLEQLASGRNILLPCSAVDAFASRWSEQVEREDSGLLSIVSLANRGPPITPLPQETATPRPQ